jgi:hypothetical protein
LRMVIRAAALLLWMSVCIASVQAGPAQTPAPKPAADPPGKEILTRKCFQCHAASMWSSLRQDRKAWEGVLYRMVGRGALWTEAEITAMADFLAQTRGSK